jgi:hypothetical protein
MKSTKLYWILVAALCLVFLAGCTSPPAIDSQSKITDAVTPWTACPFIDNPMDFQFVILADRTTGSRPAVFNKAIRQVNLLQPEFVMCVGDLIHGDTDDRDILQEQYDEVDAILDSLDMRFFRVAGNHDFSNKAMKDMYLERYGFSYYHFIYKNVLFLIVNTEDPVYGNISDTQVRYVKRILQENKNVRWTLVFLHQPLFIEEDGKLNGGWARIEDVLKYRPHSVFAGHLHSYAKYEKHGQKYIRLATTGGRSNLSGVADGKFDHMLWVTMTDRGPVIANLMLDGIYDENVRVLE